MLLSFLLDSSLFLRLIGFAEKWSFLCVNVCFTALFIISFFKIGTRKVCGKIFLMSVVLSLSPILYKALFIQTPSQSDARKLFFNGLIYFTEYFLLIIRAGYSSIETDCDGQSKNSECEPDCRASFTSVAGQIKDNGCFADNKPVRPVACDGKNFYPLPESKADMQSEKSPNSPLPSICSRPAANISEIPLRKTEIIKMTRPGKLNADYLRQCIFSLENKKLSADDLAEFYSLKNDFLFTDDFLSKSDVKTISDKSCRLIRLMARYSV